MLQVALGRDEATELREGLHSCSQVGRPLQSGQHLGDGVGAACLLAVESDVMPCPVLRLAKGRGLLLGPVLLVQLLVGQRGVLLTNLPHEEVSRYTTDCPTKALPGSPPRTSFSHSPAHDAALLPASHRML